MTLDYKQKALDHVKNVCPELMELSFGCWVESTNFEERYKYTKKVGRVDKDTDIVIYAEDGNHDDMEHFRNGNMRIIGHTPHLEHWLRGINPTSPVRVPVELHADNTMVIGSRVLYDLTKDGENQSEEFYKAYCEIVG